MLYSSEAFAKKKIEDLYAVFGKKPPAATVQAIRDMLDKEEGVSEAFLEHAVGELSRLRRLPDNVGLALLDRLQEWRAARSMGTQSGASGGRTDAESCVHCGGRGWLTVYCTTRPGVAPAMVRCVCNDDPQLQSLPAYTRETADRIPGGSLKNPWAVPGARDAWLEARRPGAVRWDTADVETADGGAAACPC